MVATAIFLHAHNEGTLRTLRNCTEALATRRPSRRQGGTGNEIPSVPQTQRAEGERKIRPPH
jgi:hypothetical protein